MAHPLHPASRDKLPTVVHGTGEETAAGPKTETVSKADFIPTKLAHYKIQHKLGQGGMGWVLLAEDTQLGRRVALKVMRRPQAADKETRERFFREAKSAAALKHDNIITIYHVGEDQGIPFLAMELLEGGTLQQRLEYPKPLSLGAAVRIAREIASGLSVAHERCVVHRDIKPTNIWLESPKGRVKILDFGLARNAEAAAGLTQAGEIIGTPHYMAPEQARAKAVDARCDLFSLGCILYRMTTGRLPFAGDTLLATLTAIAVDTPTPVLELNPQAPQALADLIGRLLAKDPAERPATAADVIKELRAIEADLAASKSGQSTEVPPFIQINTGQPTSAGSSSKKGLPLRVSGKTRRASPLWQWIVVGAIGVILVAGLLWLLVWIVDANSRRTPRQPSASRSGSQFLAADLSPETANLPDWRRTIRLDHSYAASRSVAEWVLACGGESGTAQVDVRLADRREAVIADSALLPTDPFTLIGIRLCGAADLAEADLTKLAGLDSLDRLDLSGTGVTNQGVKRLTGLDALTTLDLSQTEVSDEAVAHVAATCPNLRCLRIGGSRCTAAVVTAVVRLKQLRDLSLAGLPIGDGQLGSIAALQSLENLDLSRTQVSTDGLARLRSVLPACQVRPDLAQLAPR